MPTRPPNPDPSQPHADEAPAGFSGMGAAGLGFFQDWMKAASSALPNLGSTAAQGATAWAMPTLDPQELEKRIQDLKTVQFWLEQNSRMIGMTIQTMEVQRMTLNTLHGMKVPMDALRESLKAQVPGDVIHSAEAPTSVGTADGAPAPGAIDPMRWWSTLTQQFTNLAAQAVQAGQSAMNAPAAAPGEATPPGSDAAPSQEPDTGVSPSPRRSGAAKKAPRR